jgi:hypothetical protein
LELKRKLGYPEGQDYFGLLDRYEDENDEIPPVLISGDVSEVLSRMIILQNSLTAYHIEYKKLTDHRKIFTTMTPTFIVHTLRESMRANYELEELAEGRLIK